MTHTKICIIWLINNGENKLLIGKNKLGHLILIYMVFFILVPSIHLPVKETNIVCRVNEMKFFYLKIDHLVLYR